MELLDYGKVRNRTASGATLLSLAVLLHLVSCITNRFGNAGIMVGEALCCLLYWLIFILIRKNKQPLRTVSNRIKIAITLISAATVILISFMLRLLFNEMNDYYRTAVYYIYFIEVMCVISAAANQIPALYHLFSDNQ